MPTTAADQGKIICDLAQPGDILAPCVRDVARVPDHSRLLRAGSPAAEVTKPSGSVVDALHPGTKVLEGIDGCHRPPVMPARSPVPGVSRHRRADRVS